jgi:tetratricopeptide (TPR) repeat protein
VTIRTRPYRLSILLALAGPSAVLQAQGTFPEWGRALTPAEGRGLRAEITRLSRRLNLRESTLIAIARVLGANLRNISFAELVGQVQAQAERAGELQSRIGELQRQIVSLTDANVRSPAEQALAQVTAAFNQGRLGDADREFAALEMLRRSDSAAVRAAWFEAVEARARVAELRLDFERAVGLRLAAAREEGRISAAHQWRLTAAAAEARVRQGEMRADNRMLELAIALCVNQVLPLAPRSERPLDWAATHRILGNALWNIGNRESGTARLVQAADAYRQALEEFRRDQAPREWAITMIGLGNALSSIGERDRNAKRLQAAIDAYRAALQELPRASQPGEWAMVQNNLGNALSTLGEIDGEGRPLEEAVAVFRAALEVFTREGAPLQWATTQNNLGAALGTLGGRESGTARLREAAAAFRAALQERTRDRMPLQWATTTANLSHMVTEIALRSRDLGLLEEAEREARDARVVLVASDHAPGLALADLVLRRIAELRTQMTGPAVHSQ